MWVIPLTPPLDDHTRSSKMPRSKQLKTQNTQNTEEHRCLRSSANVIRNISRKESVQTAKVMRRFCFLTLPRTYSKASRIICLLLDARSNSSSHSTSTRRRVTTVLCGSRNKPYYWSCPSVRLSVCPIRTLQKMLNKQSGQHRIDANVPQGKISDCYGF